MMPNVTDRQTAVAALEWVALNLEGLPHPDDRGHDIVNAGTGRRVMSDLEAVAYDAMMDDVFTYLEGDVYGIALDIMHDKTPDTFGRIS